MNHSRLPSATSASFISDGLDRIFARAAACTPEPAASTSRSPASSRLSMSSAFTFMVSVILATFCSASVSMLGTQFGLSTRTASLFSV